MSIVVRFSPTALTSEKYDESLRRLEAAGVASGRTRLPRLLRVQGNLLVSEVWDSREQFDAFGEQLMPILGDIGIGFDKDPEIFEVQEEIRR